MTLLVPAEPPPTTSEKLTAPSSDYAPAASGRAKTAWRMGGPMADNRIVATVKEFGSLINTILIVGALFGIVYKWGGETTRIDNQITANADAIAKLTAEEQRRWETHAELHKERLGEVRAREGAVDQRLSAIEQTIEADSRKIENGIYRIGILEDARKSDAAVLRELSKTVNDLAGDVKVVLREIQQKGNP